MDAKFKRLRRLGLSGGFIAGDDLDRTIDEPSFQEVGAMLGAARDYGVSTIREICSMSPTTRWNSLLRSPAGNVFRAVSVRSG